MSVQHAAPHAWMAFVQHLRTKHWACLPGFVIDFCVQNSWTNKALQSIQFTKQLPFFRVLTGFIVSQRDWVKIRQIFRFFILVSPSISIIWKGVPYDPKALFLLYKDIPIFPAEFNILWIPNIAIGISRRQQKSFFTLGFVSERMGKGRGILPEDPLVVPSNWRIEQCS